MLNKLTHKFFRLFQTPEDNKYNTILALIFLAISCCVLVLLLKPSERYITRDDLSSKSLAYKDVDIEVHTATARSGLRKTYFIVLSSADTQYKLQADVFKDVYSIDEVMTTLRRNNKAVLWYFPEDSLKILGLEVGGISISASKGLDLHNDSRLVMIFLVVISALLSSGFYLSHRILKGNRNGPAAFA